MSAQKFLIATDVDDVHAAAVTELLRQQGLKVDHFCSLDYPGAAHVAHRMAPGQKEVLNFSSSHQSLRMLDYDVVWWRRYFSFPVDISHIHPDDRWFVESGNRAYARDFPFLVAPHARWINSPRGESAAVNKPLQLRIARRLGLQVMDTLFTNSRLEAEAFIKELAARGKETVFKTFYPHAWVGQENGAEKIAYAQTCLITVDRLVDDSMFRLCPAILQEKCNTQYEIRALFMGDSYVAMRYNDRDKDGWRLDARRAMLQPKGGTRCDLPVGVARLCTQLLAELGCSFGSFDLLVDRDGQHVFLEINPEGQFLWMEAACPELKVLEPVCKFIQHGRVDIDDFERRAGDITFAQVRPTLVPERSASSARETA